MHLYPFEKSFFDQDFLQAINQHHGAIHTQNNIMDPLHSNVTFAQKMHRVAVIP